MFTGSRLLALFSFLFFVLCWVVGQQPASPASTAASEPQSLADTARKPIEQRIERYRQRVEEYESDPKTGEGKKELLQKARDFEVLRDTRQRQDRYFDYAEALLQIAIVLASVSIVTGMLGVRLLSYAMAGIGVVLLFDAFTLSFAIPFL